MHGTDGSLHAAPATIHEPYFLAAAPGDPHEGCRARRFRPGRSRQTRGNGGSDTLYGFGGNDFFNGGSGADRYYGGDGNDTFYARDGVRDLVLDGGRGTDKAQRDGDDPRTSIEQTIA